MSVKIALQIFCGLKLSSRLEPNPSGYQACQHFGQPQGRSVIIESFRFLNINLGLQDWKFGWQLRPIWATAELFSTSRRDFRVIRLYEIDIFSFKFLEEEEQDRDWFQVQIRSRPWYLWWLKCTLNSNNIKSKLEMPFYHMMFIPL